MLALQSFIFLPAIAHKKYLLFRRFIHSCHFVVVRTDWLIDSTKRRTTGASNIMIFKGQDAWRNHHLFQRLWASPLPGFRNAVIIFGAYLVIDQSLSAIKPKESRIESGHGHH